MVTMILVGLWHGATWTFVFWGFYHGVLLVAYRLMAADPDGKHHQSRARTMASVLMMFHLTCLGWLLFRATSLGQAFDLLSTIIFAFGPGDQTVVLLTQLFGYLVILLVVQCIQWAKGDLLVLDRTPIAVRGVAYGVLFYLTVLHGGTSNSFIYFQF